MRKEDVIKGIINGSIKKVESYNYSDYDSDLCRNGGRYGFSTFYTRQSKGWEVKHTTTADMSYCSYCGSFGHSCGCSGPHYEDTEWLINYIKNKKIDLENEISLQIGEEIVTEQ